MSGGKAVKIVPKSTIYPIYGFSLDEKGPFKDTIQNLT